MKKFILRSLGFACFFLAVLLLVGTFLVRRAKDSHIYLDEYGHKESLLKECPSPRVVFLGGSNIAFGIDSKMVEDSIGVSAVNYGLQAGVGLRLMMVDALQYCRKGDILVVAPEYEHFYGNVHGEKSTLSLLSLLNPHIIVRFDAGNFKVAGSGVSDALAVLASNYLGASGEGAGGRYKYSALSFNEYGDESRHWTFPSDDITLDQNYIGDEFDETSFVDFLESVSILEGRGVDVLIIPPPVYRGFYDRYRKKIEFIDDRLAAEGYPFATSLESSVFDREEMFDSDYHLSRKGIDLRMAQIISLLRKNGR